MAVRELTSRRQLQNHPQRILLQIIGREGSGIMLIKIFVADEPDELLAYERELLEAVPGREDVFLLNMSGFAGVSLKRSLS